MKTSDDDQNCFFLQQLMSDFVSIELIYHVKALEKLSECGKYIDLMNVEADLEVSIYMECE